MEKGNAGTRASAFLDLGAGLLPAVDPGSVMLHVLVAELRGDVGGGEIGGAVFVAAISDDEGVFVLRQERRDFLFLGDEVDRAGDAALRIGLAAVYVEERDGFL